ncbi:hypothetical protein PENANT_c014G02478 [Penicillium antarcticum]|uniref:Uncharacterized protein n=1 Tax=Penicillium antarcticum TaxID=416450 RepID=A0A1V6Q4H8_9EURO|nr:hypothetical protein PENANT_c014G02478 [Penicillium antarcticum]
MNQSSNEDDISNSSYRLINLVNTEFGDTPTYSDLVYFHGVASDVTSSAMKVALVTASSAGLGTAIAKSLAPNMRVVNNYWSNAERAELIQKEMGIIAGSDKYADSNGKNQPRFASIRANLGNKESI